jgi:hypothetical protein
MPILLWYLPFTMFSGVCDLVFAELEMQVNRDHPADGVHPATKLNRNADMFFMANPLR